MSAGRHSAKTGGAECEHLGIAEIRRAASAFLESRDPNIMNNRRTIHESKPAPGERRWSRKVNSTPAPSMKPDWPAIVREAIAAGLVKKPSPRQP